MRKNDDVQCVTSSTVAWFFSTPVIRLIVPLNFIDTASPPASSAGWVIRLPLDSLVKLFCRAALFLDKWKLAVEAAAFVFGEVSFVNDDGGREQHDY